MQVSSDVGRGTIVTLLIPVAELPRVPQQSVSSRPAQLTYMYGFEGIGLKRLAGAISAQLASEYRRTFEALHTADLGPQRLATCTPRRIWERQTICSFRRKLAGKLQVGSRASSRESFVTSSTARRTPDSSCTGMPRTA